MNRLLNRFNAVNQPTTKRLLVQNITTEKLKKKEIKKRHREIFLQF